MKAHWSSFGRVATLSTAGIQPEWVPRLPAGASPSREAHGCGYGYEGECIRTNLYPGVGTDCGQLLQRIERCPRLLKPATPVCQLLCGRLTLLWDYLPLPVNRNVWSAALSQAKNESDRMVCANVFGLRWSTRLLAMMECAALSSYLVRQSG